ncbi:MAG: Glu-tRNA(Gln) amidotransferase subunit GatD [Candidatus Thorarchaeota archaeon]
MASKEAAGYFGEAQKILKKANVQVGDRIQVKTQQSTFEGIVIPRAEIGADEEHIVIKLDSGYNVGFHVKKIQDLQRLKSGQVTRPELPSVERKTKKGLPMVSILSTGGTIASRVDYHTGAVNPALSAGDLYNVVPELGDFANIRAEVLYSIFSENLTPKHWSTIAKKTAQHLEESAGVVIPHGTDTMAFTAAALSFALRNLPSPVILTGSQRSSDRPSSDAATNLTGSVIAAAQGPFAEVVIAMHKTPDDTSIALHRGTQVRKCHTSRRDAFKTINTDLLGEVKDGQVHMFMKKSAYQSRDANRQLQLQTKFDPKVALIKTTPGMSGDLIDVLIDKGYHGIVIEGTGLGHAPEAIFKSVERASSEKIPIIMTSQCIWGRVQMRVYRTGVELVQRGVIPAEDMLAETAFVKLMWVLAQTRDLQEVRKYMLQNMAGEITDCSKRSQYEEMKR